jgi:hypothetical protein
VELVLDLLPQVVKMKLRPDGSTKRVYVKDLSAQYARAAPHQLQVQCLDEPPVQAVLQQQQCRLIDRTGSRNQRRVLRADQPQARFVFVAAAARCRVSAAYRVGVNVDVDDRLLFERRR